MTADLDNSDATPAGDETIESICDRFERDLVAGRSPDLDAVLNADGNLDQAALFRELLAVEVDWRRRTGGSCGATDYLERFPGMQPQIEEFFANRPDDRLPYVPERGPTVEMETEQSTQPSIPDRFHPGERFGRYQIISPIARGGMGVVYKARDEELERDVALKIIRSAEFAYEEQIARFQREARAAAKFDHPNIVPIYEVGASEGVHFFSMALIDGPSLSDRIADEPMASREAASLVMQVGRAVQHAHEQGIVHRDLKPQNILLDTDGTPRIADFGLARDLGQDSELTATGQIVGTPAYMPPEQARGEPGEIGQSADIYALGAILYRVLVGRPPFQGANTAETLMQVVAQDPVAPRQLIRRSSGTWKPSA